MDMRYRFSPKAFPDRVIVIDATVCPPTEKMDCTECGKMVEELYQDFEFCQNCYRKWSAQFCKEWLRSRFGEL